MTKGSRWRPFHIRKHGKQREEEWDALVDGVPPWLRQSLIDWLNEHFLLSPDDGYHVSPDQDILRLIEVRLGVDLDWSGNLDWAHRSLLKKCVTDGDLFLSVIDLALLGLGENERNHENVDRLEGLLRAGRSAWMVGPDRRGLVARVAPEATAAAREVIDSGERAGQYLSEAWQHAYGRNPNASAAYREAVRAIEAAVCPVIIPKNKKATLGRAIIALKQAKPGAFATIFMDTVPGVTPLDAVRGLMELVWTNELDRHGTDDESIPLHVSMEQAHAALHAAVTLVQWFRRGVVQRAPS